MTRTLLLALLAFACGTKDDSGAEYETEAGTTPIELDEIVTAERPSPRSEVYGVGDPVTNSIMIPT